MQNRRVDVDKDRITIKSCPAIGNQGVVVVFAKAGNRWPHHRDARIGSYIPTSRTANATAIDARSIDLHGNGDDVNLRSANIDFGGNDISEGALIGMISDPLWFDPNAQR